MTPLLERTNSEPFSFPFRHLTKRAKFICKICGFYAYQLKSSILPNSSTCLICSNFIQTSPLLIKIYSNHTIKAGSSAYAETEPLLWLMIWTIAERQSFQAECFPAEKYGISYSAYKECEISFIQVTDVLRLSWSHFVDLADKKYARYLSKK